MQKKKNKTIGRPPSKNPAETNREHPVTTNFTKKEHEALIDNARDMGLGVSVYIRFKLKSAGCFISPEE